MTHSRMIALASAAILAACVPPVGGTGALKDGRPLASTLNFTSLTTATVIIISPDGWSCTSTRDELAPDNARTNTIRQAPISCTDGATGVSLWSLTQHPDAMTISFSLADGRSGSVRHALNAN